jgi:predicted dehydrogenase
VRVAIVTEPGGAHLELLVRGVAESPEAGPTALADPSGESVERVRAALGARGAGLRVFGDWREMLRAFAPEFAIVTVEARRNPEIAAAALEAGAHVLCEKPPCIRLEEFEALAKTADSRGRGLSLALATRAHPAAREARDLVRRGWLGRLYGASMTWVGDQTRLHTAAWRNSWFASKERAGGGKLAFHGIHYLDLAQYIAGERIVEVNAFCRNVGGSPIPLEDAAAVAFRFSGGATGTLNAGYYLDRGNSNFLELWGEYGWLRFDPFQPLRWRSTHPLAPRGEQTARPAAAGSEYRDIVREAIRAAAGAGEPFMTTADSLAVVRAVFAGYRASASGRAQRV